MAAQTVYQKFEEVVKSFPQNIALGFKDGSHYKTLTYKKLLERVNRVVTGLKNLGIKPLDRLAILSRNRSEWVELDLALNKLGAISVPIHTSLSPRIIEYILKNSQVKYLAIGDFLSKYYEIRSQVNLVEVITFPKIEWQENFIHFHDFYKEPIDQSEAEGSEVASIIYTSGTTGDPKGVILTNQNFLKNVWASAQLIPVTSKDVFLSFLPLSHVLERTGGCYAPLFFGAAVYFASSYKTVAEDMKKIKPTIVVSIPRLFEKFYEKVMDGLASEKSAFKQTLVYGSLKTSRAYLNSKREGSAWQPLLEVGHWFSDRLVLKKIRQHLGGRLKFAISGGATLDPSIARFFESLGIKILEGYGLTETSPIVAVNPLNDYRFNTVGKVVSGVEVKIAADKEILVKGHNLMKGYDNNSTATQETFTAEGWLKTGDLGFLDADGYLSIIGRKKEMLVLSTGKNVNPVDLEIALQKSRYINQALVYGDKQKYLRALIVPDYEHLKKFADASGFQLEYHELLKYQPIIDLIKAEITEQLKDFPDNEQIKDFTLLDKPFSEEREELTPTLKLRREKILENYKNQVSGIGNRGSGI